MLDDISERKERPAYPRFETRTEEDKAASVREGRYVVREYEVVKLTPSYSKDSIEFHVQTWMDDIEKNLRDGRIPEDWAKFWRDSYKNWKNGQELPLNGTPIKGWGVISQAQQETLIHINCKTVEDLAAVNEEGMRRMGMGALDLRTKAQAWLKSMKDHGGSTIKIASLEQENAVLRTSVETLEKKVAALVAAQPADEPPISYDNVHEITSSELLDDAEPAAPTRSRRRLTPAAAA
jgi:hypothetical protein